ncbi:MAG: hypothetical protein DIJKHBIC_00621 [Thermoanaerobaculia bacterium]|nr:hypothetical protein [Thermoanaerobaculia bacterium]
MPKPKAAASRKISLSRARKEWIFRQHLASPADAPAETIVSETGWIRTLGGADVYVACWARQKKFDFEALNGAVERRELQVLPSVRNCIYLVPRRDAALALSVAEEQWRPRTARDLERAGSDWKEVEAVAAAALEVLGKARQTPDGLRKALPPNSVRSLGEKGKKAGLSSVLPVALRLLEFNGKARRALPGGRLDSEKYVWEAGDTLRMGDLPSGTEARQALLARRFFEFASPASAAHFSDWAGIGKKAAALAIESASLEPLSIEGRDEIFFGLPETAELDGASGGVALLPFEDNLPALHGGPGLLTDPEHHNVPVPAWGSSGMSTLKDGAHMALRPIIAEGRIAGFWEFDPDSSRVVTKLLRPGIPASRLAQLCGPLEALLAQDLGHGHSFSLDTDEKLRERVEFLRAL